ncbi:PREDICTED: probable RNA-dependent RNA polymerase 1 [Nelumbo nucifera]|uniref:RNA-dependent RNA polymerase n=2 Tax=Nelumbo nucifera TaxID=4432 RepID=A0A1U8B786_NELNU|nr:PREDICTED: probable RNA-dependent RNA polymerase 1 [Nelumbo nucifera]XP_010275424.1 PREDICTED: probable RNA-dependent RNA polymerase 1 [Nelumbo nucifera]XP_010275500.1 PREDICTED: probable RNA-dependent RNA polymerase 1 [Nelumbo nucifera]XP_010275583.1 PREDICTED: probable RNA-dependent RNA polymerase 1 [Nelumbo nucifera]XP_010275643.1 PREDICTED: probable RNA-dependent RNA polymerase 1 [Nelumbo nucifera]XP_010275710.1 PREDICTED: probable RNA-dependent RNA polymerase 1 [Nelumbo nucifera]DAD35
MGKTIHLSGFPANVTAEAVKELLERYTGDGTVYALKVRHHKNKGHARFAFVIVQFTTSGSADVITSLVNRRLYYGTHYLKVRDVERDIVAKPRMSLLSLEHTTLHFGCQVSPEKFSVLWKGADVAVRFEFGLRRLHFFLSQFPIDYKLGLSYENIWQIQLRHPRGQNKKFLLIQMFGVPRIFKKVKISLENMFEDPILNYFREPDDQWDRTTDFTPLCCIGQSSALCLELPYSYVLPNIREYFAYYKEDEGPFVLESGATFSRSLSLVPIVGPSQGSDIPYEILFKVCSLVQNGCLSGPTLDAAFFRLVDPNFISIDYIENALEKLYHLKECCYEPVNWLTKQYRAYCTLKRPPKLPSISLDDGLVYVRRIQITPCKVYFCGPEVIVSNRVLREYSRYIDNFIRISFVDEDLDKIHSTDISPRTSFANEKGHTEIYDRILSTLKNGIVIGDKKFDFLAFSSSQLRDNSAWMFASSNGYTAASIRQWMGDFSKIRNVAKYAARLGQSFSSSRETLNVYEHETEIIDDIKVEWRGIEYIFSDGIGKISADFAKQVAKKCGFKGSFPSAFQIRYGGYKGVVAVDPTSTKKLSLRRSMSKYESRNTKLDVLSWSKYQPCFLNRQIITLLSTLGVRDSIFEKKQKEAMDQLDAILTDSLKAQEALEIMSPGENTNILKEMLLCGYEPNAEPFLSMMLQTFRASKLLELRTKTRIFVPNGRSLLGCLDETRTLKYGEVFVQVSSIGRRQFHESSLFVFSGNEPEQQKFIVEGKIIVAKNPCLHPGDVRLLQAVNVPALHHMVDCVVFPQEGKRPHPNECSGSDLDGDVYFVCWDPDLIPPRQIQPMEYLPEPSVNLDHDVTIEEIEEYFTNYIVNESLGIIANAHTAFADKEPKKAESDACLQLAKLFSIAVDFPKTGVPAEIPQHLYVKEYPDFMEKLDKPTYVSERVIGKLFRAVKDIAPQTWSIRSFTQEVARRSYDPDMEVDGFEDYLSDAYYYKGEYDSKLGNLMDYYGIKTEAEILSGNIMKLSKSFTKKRDAEAISLAVRSLRKEARAWFNEKSGPGPEADDVYAKASAWYHVTYHPDYWGCYNEGLKRDHFLSFPWCVYDKLIHIKREKASIRRIRIIDESSLGLQFRRSLRLN